MINYIIVSLVTGVLFGFLDGFINANPLAQKLFEVYKPIAKTAINIPLGFIIDISYGFLMTGIFFLLYKSLPGQTGLVKGISFGILVWIFRVVMYAASQYMMFEVPVPAVGYMLTTGLAEMVALGALIGLLLKI
jgi:hypothetical protein